MEYYYNKGLAYGWGFWGLFNTFVMALFLLVGRTDLYLINNLSNMSFFFFLIGCGMAVITWIGPPMFVGYELSDVKPPQVNRLIRYYNVWKGIFIGSFAFCAFNFAALKAIEFATGWKIL